MAQSRLLRGLALANQLDPDTTLPDDLLLLQRHEKGQLMVEIEYDTATSALAAEGS